jgi:hypothetical protein
VLVLECVIFVCLRAASVQARCINWFLLMTSSVFSLFFLVNVFVYL